MDIIDIIKSKDKAKDFYYIGERLKEARLELLEKDISENNKIKNESLFNGVNFSKYININYNTLVNAERGVITINTMKLIMCFYKFGYNPLWFILPDNQFINRKNVTENIVYQFAVQDNFEKLESDVFKALEQFKKTI
ncbi:hypothetical protein FHS04_002796 [Mesoflavibacter sabulilitoris]|uniref:Uncharacterized protein n=1 Tax=Mesoflavibacter zeaxanthinifaciens subsp. sabulilitoris TaxID=1520893 RepID=A0A2T1NNL8_9FLAO|nr:hypothetical protein [Mesoflavibacter zeaxanthinifaciens]MBB3125252.1 hypothetical protein [Mesoflavibacter zeaxanthinifaciens subsp. sabulilitoris]PSG94487.1 hypothetical protein C7H61_00710 [Mesoflavibacter zeaxanthinifaciens subsp. sabulilitoris]